VIGLKLLKSSLFSLVFLMIGSSRPSFRTSGKVPDTNDELIRDVITGTNSTEQDFNIRVGIGSRGHEVFICKKHYEEVFICKKHYPSHRDLACQHARSRYTGKRSVIFILFSKQGKISLVNLSKCFLANRDNFSPNEQALSALLQQFIYSSTVSALIVWAVQDINFQMYSIVRI
jgi:hypothetical protein